MNTRFREPVSGLTHLFGAILSLVGLVILIISSSNGEKILNLITLSVFGLSLILLYTASSLYHLLNATQKVIKTLRRIDHSMIYVLIAGTYTPICLIALKGAWGWSLFAIIWTLAFAGILLKILWFDAPRWLYTLFYIVMGWLVIIAIIPLAKALPEAGMLWLFAGGIFYTIGGIIYATKWPKITSEYFGFHEIFHIFVLIGSFSHYWFILKYIAS